VQDHALLRVVASYGNNVTVVGRWAQSHCKLPLHGHT